METKGFLRGTLIHTKRGPLPIEAVNVGDEVLTHNNTYSAVIDIQKKQVSGQYRLQVQGSPATFAHANQLFYVREKTQKWNNEQQVSERVFSDPIWKKAKDLTKDDFILMGKVNTSNNIKNITKEDCWLLGKFLIKNYVSLKDKTITIYIPEKFKTKLDKIIEGYDHTLTKYKSSWKCVIKDSRFYELCMESRMKKETVIPLSIFTLPDDYQITFLQSYSESKGKITDDYYILKDSCNKLVYQIGILVASINSYGGYSLFIDGEQSWRVQYKDFVPKSANFARIDHELWQPVRQINEIRAHRGTAYSLVTEEGSFVANNLACK